MAPKYRKENTTLQKWHQSEIQSRFEELKLTEKDGNVWWSNSSAFNTHIFVHFSQIPTNPGWISHTLTSIFITECWERSVNSQVCFPHLFIIIFFDTDNNNHRGIKKSTKGWCKINVSPRCACVVKPRVSLARWSWNDQNKISCTERTAQAEKASNWVTSQ